MSELRKRLEDARDLKTDPRDLENLCAELAPLVAKFEHLGPFDDETLQDLKRMIPFGHVVRGGGAGEDADLAGSSRQLVVDGYTQPGENDARCLPIAGRRHALGATAVRVPGRSVRAAPGAAREVTMPTIAEPVDHDVRKGRTQSILEYYQRGMLGEATTEVSLRMMRYEPEEIWRMMREYRPPR